MREGGLGVMESVARDSVSEKAGFPRGRLSV